MFTTIYTIISIVVATIDLSMAYACFKKNTRSGKYLGITCIFTAIVDITYLLSITQQAYFKASLWSSFYFISIDWMLIFLLKYVFVVTKKESHQYAGHLMRIFAAYAIFDSIILAINPFKELALHYIKNDRVIIVYTYGHRMLLFNLHLAFAYLLVTLAIIHMFQKAFTVPREYRLCYTPIAFAIVFIVFVNALFLFVPDLGLISLLDYSIWMYSLATYLMYWGSFYYATRVLVNRLKMDVIDHIDQGILLFDYEENLILCNQTARKFLPDVDFHPSLDIRTFCEICDNTDILDTNEESFSMQCYKPGQKITSSLRCDYRILKNDQMRITAYLLVFSDIAQDTDLLTGFQSWDSFKKFIHENQESHTQSTAVAVCDINGLSVYNQLYSVSEGDKLIQTLAQLMREHFPKGTYFVRGNDAMLIALTYNYATDYIQNCLINIQHDFPENIQYGVSQTREQCPDILTVIKEAEAGMSVKKMLDQNSSHSSVLNSLVRALEECDTDTEAHVKRTQKLGELLGQRIHLSDIDQSNLSLLCILHDIGKVGVPLDILNKPGKLTSEEFSVLRSHTEKGYKIAMSSKAFQPIAPMIKYHHERWDGNGYPDGLSRESIPLLSRIIAVIDAYDAMVNNRSYRYALSKEEAICELKSGAGTQFDPYIVSQFLQMISDMPDDELNMQDNPNTITIANYHKTSQPEKTWSPSTTDHCHPLRYSRYLLDNDMNIITIDDNFTEITGYTKEDVADPGLHQIDLIPDEDKTTYLLTINDLLANNSNAYVEHRIQKKNHQSIYVLCFGRQYYDITLKEYRSEIIITTLDQTQALKSIITTEKERAQIRLQHWEDTYRRDSMTGLLSHNAFQNDLEETLLKGTSKILFIMMDVNKFKKYNDTYGHHAGDSFLVSVAQSLLSHTRKDDLVCRMGGDEFAIAIFFNLITSRETILERAKAIYRQVNADLMAQKGGTSISMGVALSDSHSTFNSLYEQADVAMYHAKENENDHFEYDF